MTGLSSDATNRVGDAVGRYFNDQLQESYLLRRDGFQMPRGAFIPPSSENYSPPRSLGRGYAQAGVVSRQGLMEAESAGDSERLVLESAKGGVEDLILSIQQALVSFWIDNADEIPPPGVEICGAIVPPPNDEHMDPMLALVRAAYSQGPAENIAVPGEWGWVVVEESTTPLTRIDYDVVKQEWLWQVFVRMTFFLVKRPWWTSLPLHPSGKYRR